MIRLPDVNVPSCNRTKVVISLGTVRLLVGDLRGGRDLLREKWSELGDPVANDLWRLAAIVVLIIGGAEVEAGQDV